MVYGVQARLALSTPQRRNQVVNAITARIEGKQRLGADLIQGAAARVGPNALTLELRFIGPLDADDLRAHLESTLTGQLLPLAGSWLRVHACTHDEGLNVCTATFERVW